MDNALTKKQKLFLERGATREYVRHLVQENHARLSGDDVLGKAADGVEVLLGQIDDFGVDALGSYLRKFPYPTQW